MSSNEDQPIYVTNGELKGALEKLEAKVPSRWEVRSLILGAIVLSHYNLPPQLTTAAVIAGALGVAGKAVSVLFFRS